MERKTYSEKLKDPRWQKKRLEIMQRDDFKCQMCESKENTLHVHHLSYEKGKLPWEYNDDNMITLCEGCHSIETFERKEMEDLLINSLRTKGYSITDITNLCFHLPTKKYSDESIIKQVSDLFN